MSVNQLTVLGAGTVVRGDLFCQGQLVLEGGVEGNVLADRVIIKGSGWVRGNLSCRSLTIELGGVVDGQVSVVEGREVSRLVQPQSAALGNQGQKALTDLTIGPSEEV